MQKILLSFTKKIDFYRKYTEKDNNEIFAQIKDNKICNINIINDNIISDMNEWIQSDFLKKINTWQFFLHIHHCNFNLKKKKMFKLQCERTDWKDLFKK